MTACAMPDSTLQIWRRRRPGFRPAKYFLGGRLPAIESCRTLAPLTLPKQPSELVAALLTASEVAQLKVNAD